MVYVEDVNRADISSEDRHHLARVLRLRPDSALVLCDGRGSWRAARFGEVISFTSDVLFEPRPEPTLTLSVALPKGDRADWLMQKATEIGIDAVVVVESEHSVVRWTGDKAPRQLERLGRIVRAAGAQSRRAWLPEVVGPRRFDVAASVPGTVLAAPGGGPLTPEVRNVMIGPEGGWSPAEISGGRPTVGLGPQVLRVETAALVASTLLVALRSRLVLPPRFAPENALGG